MGGLRGRGRMWVALWCKKAKARQTSRVEKSRVLCIGRSSTHPGASAPKVTFSTFIFVIHILIFFIFSYFYYYYIIYFLLLIIRVILLLVACSYSIQISSGLHCYPYLFDLLCCSMLMSVLLPLFILQYYSDLRRVCV